MCVCVYCNLITQVLFDSPGLCFSSNVKQEQSHIASREKFPPDLVLPLSTAPKKLKAMKVFTLTTGEELCLHLDGAAFSLPPFGLALQQERTTPQWQHVDLYSTDY